MTIHEMMKSPEEEIRNTAFALYEADHSLMSIEEGIDVIKWLDKEISKYWWCKSSKTELRSKLSKILFDIDCDLITKKRIYAAIAGINSDTLEGDDNLW